jgi:hypothetical protein
LEHSIDLNDASEPVDAQLPVERRLAQIDRLPRQAFLLVSLEGFSEAEAAEILDTDVAALRDLVKEAVHELAAEIATDVLIIEDEALIAMDLSIWSRARSPRDQLARSSEAVSIAKTPGASFWPTSISPTTVRASMPSTSCCAFRSQSSSSPPIGAVSHQQRPEPGC